jgi:hypothetical protein
MTVKSNTKQPSAVDLMFGDGTPRKALATSLVVGTILVGINHGDVLLAGEPLEFHKIILTYCVPYLVTTWGAVTGKIAATKSK